MTHRSKNTERNIKERFQGSASEWTGKIHELILPARALFDVTSIIKNPRNLLKDTALMQILRDVARETSLNAYQTYSKFTVGAAILGQSGKIYPGCNVENASYGITNCAERVGIGKAISESERSILAVVVFTPTDSATPPCGACRQAINEFGPNALVISTCNTEDTKVSQLDQLLPNAFGPHNLGK